MGRVRGPAYNSKVKVKTDTVKDNSATTGWQNAGGYGDYIERGRYVSR